MSNIEKYFLNQIKFHYTDCKGRAKRKEYWMYILFWTIGYVVSLIDVSGMLPMIYTVALLPAGISLGVRRLHDTNRSAWWLLLIIIWPIWLVLMCLPSDLKDNRYGAYKENSLEKNKKKNILSVFICVFLFVPFYSFCVQASCHINPTVHVSFKNSNPKYYSMPAKSVQNSCINSDYVPIGCTYYWIVYDYNYKTKNVKGCFGINKINMKLYYKDFYVYIDDRYPKGSCEYNAIKKHEDLHVKIDQTVNIKKIEDSLKKCVIEINKRNMSRSALSSAVKKCARQAFDLDERIRKEKNKKLDLDKTKQPNLVQNCPKKIH